MPSVKRLITEEVSELISLRQFGYCISTSREDIRRKNRPRSMSTWGGEGEVEGRINAGLLVGRYLNGDKVAFFGEHTSDLVCA